jgi:hypothetical protein
MSGAVYASIYFGLSYIMLRLTAEPTDDQRRIQAGTQPLQRPASITGGVRL